MINIRVCTHEHMHTHLLNFSLFASSKVYWSFAYYLSASYPPFYTPFYTWCWDSENYISWASCQLVSCLVLPSGDTSRRSKGSRQKRSFLPLAPKVKHLLGWQQQQQQQGWGPPWWQQHLLAGSCLVNAGPLWMIQTPFNSTAAGLKLISSKLFRVFINPYILCKNLKKLIP